LKLAKSKPYQTRS